MFLQSLIFFPLSLKVSYNVWLVKKACALIGTDASDLAAAGESIELSSFGEGEITDILNMQDGLNNLRDLLKGDLSDITKFITNPPGGLRDFKRIAAQFGVGGTIAGFTGVSLNYIIHYNDHGGQQTTATATATATSSASTATPSEWVLNTVLGTSREAFEDFVSTLPDRGKGERIIFPVLDYQTYVGIMTLEDAKAVSKNPIVDQIGSNDPMTEQDGGKLITLVTSELKERQDDGHQHDRRVVPTNIVYQHRSPLHLRMISLPKDNRVTGLNSVDDDPYLQYWYDARSQGYNSYIYVFDCGFDSNHAVSIVHSNLQTCFLGLEPIPEHRNRLCVVMCNSLC